MIRENFSKKVTRVLAFRAGLLCNNPGCRKMTAGPNSNPEKYSSFGIAAHICAASPGGPRYDTLQSPKERKSIYNGIWVCHNCSDLIDKDPDYFTVKLLHEWKQIHRDYLKELSNQKKAAEPIRGGAGGHIIIRTESLEGAGSIIANGGDGEIGGEGGTIDIIATQNKFKGNVTANGGKSFK